MFNIKYSSIQIVIAIVYLCRECGGGKIYDETKRTY